MAAVASVALPPPVALAQRCDMLSDVDADECWICLSSAGSLSRVCDCPRVSHRECLARWQLTNYGRREENFCRFCSKRLPALWKPDAAKEAEKEELRLAPVMAVRYNGPEGTREFKLRVHPGPEGLAMFKAHLKEILGFDVGPEFDVTFECQMPSTGSMLTLSGMNSYGAATHCAALLAAIKAGTQTGPVSAISTTAAATSRNVSPGQLQRQREQWDGIALQQQQQQGPQQQQLSGHAMLLPFQVPSTAVTSVEAVSPATAAAATAATAAARGPHCSRRLCQSGYVPHAPLGLGAGDKFGALARLHVAGGLPYRAMNLARGRTMPPLAASRSLGVGTSRVFQRTSSDAALYSSRPDIVFVEDMYDDLVSPGLHGAGHDRVHESGGGSWAAGGGGGGLSPDGIGGSTAAEREKELARGEEEGTNLLTSHGITPLTTSPGFLGSSSLGRDGARVVTPVATSDVAPSRPPASASVAATVAATAAEAAPEALVAVRSAAVAAAASSAGLAGSEGSSVICGGGSSSSSGGAMMKDQMSWGTSTSSLSSNWIAAIAAEWRNTQHREGLLQEGRGHFRGPARGGGRGGHDVVPAVAAVTAPTAAAAEMFGSADVRGPNGLHGGGWMRLPSRLKRAARRALDSLLPSGHPIVTHDGD